MIIKFGSAHDKSVLSRKIPIIHMRNRDINSESDIFCSKAFLKKLFVFLRIRFYVNNADVTVFVLSNTLRICCNITINLQRINILFVNYGY